MLVVLAAVALVGSLLAVGGARRYTLLAEERRAERQARLRLALWDAVWSDLREAAGQPRGLPKSGSYQAPDGVQTAVQVQAAGGPGAKDAGRFSLSVTAALDKDRREAWALAQRADGGFRILTWVER